MPRKSNISELQAEEMVPSSPVRRSARIGKNGNGSPKSVNSRRISQTEQSEVPARVTRSRRASEQSVDDNIDKEDPQSKSAPARRGRKPSLTGESSDREGSVTSKPVRGRRPSKTESEDDFETPKSNVTTGNRKKSATSEADAEAKNPVRASTRRRSSVTEENAVEQVRTPSKRTRGRLGSVDSEKSDVSAKPAAKTRRGSITQEEDVKPEEVAKTILTRSRRLSADNVTSSTPSKTPVRRGRRLSINLEESQEINTQNSKTSPAESLVTKELVLKLTPLKKKKILDQVEADLDLSVINESADDMNTSKEVESTNKKITPEKKISETNPEATVGIPTENKMDESVNSEVNNQISPVQIKLVIEDKANSPSNSGDECFDSAPQEIKDNESNKENKESNNMNPKSNDTPISESSKRVSNVFKPNQKEYSFAEPMEVDDYSIVITEDSSNLNKEAESAVVNKDIVDELTELLTGDESENFVIEETEKSVDISVKSRITTSQTTVSSSNEESLVSRSSFAEISTEPKSSDRDNKKVLTKKLKVSITVDSTDSEDDDEKRRALRRSRSKSKSITPKRNSDQDNLKLKTPSPIQKLMVARRSNSKSLSPIPGKRSLDGPDKVSKSPIQIKDDSKIEKSHQLSEELSGMETVVTTSDATQSDTKVTESIHYDFDLPSDDEDDLLNTSFQQSVNAGTSNNKQCQEDQSQEDSALGANSIEHTENKQSSPSENISVNSNELDTCNISIENSSEKVGEINALNNEEIEDFEANTQDKGDSVVNQSNIKDNLEIGKEEVLLEPLSNLKSVVKSNENNTVVAMEDLTLKLQSTDLSLNKRVSENRAESIEAEQGDSNALDGDIENDSLKEFGLKTTGSNIKVNHKIELDTKITDKSPTKSVNKDISEIETLQLNIEDVIPEQPKEIINKESCDLENEDKISITESLIVQVNEESFISLPDQAQKTFNGPSEIEDTMEKQDKKLETRELESDVKTTSTDENFQQQKKEKEKVSEKTRLSNVSTQIENSDLSIAKDDGSTLNNSLKAKKQRKSKLSNGSPKIENNGLSETENSESALNNSLNRNKKRKSINRDPRIQSKEHKEIRSTEQLTDMSPNKNKKKRNQSLERQEISSSESPEKKKKLSLEPTVAKLPLSTRLDEYASAQLHSYIESQIMIYDSDEENGEEEEEHESKKDFNEFIDVEAEEGEEDTPSEDSNQIIDEGESIGSSDSHNTDLEDDYDSEDSFICDEDVPIEILSGSEYDLDLDCEMKKKSRIIDSNIFGDEDIIRIPKKEIKEKPKKKSRIIKVSDSSSDENEENLVESKEPIVEENEGNEAIILEPSNETNLTNIDLKVENVNNDDSISQTELLKDLNTSQNRRRKSSLSIQENIMVDDGKDSVITKRINSLVESFCSAVKKGEVSFNLSLEYEDMTNSASPTVKDRKSDNIRILSTAKIYSGTILDNGPEKEAMIEAGPSSENETDHTANNEPEEAENKFEQTKVSVQHEQLIEADQVAETQQILNKKKKTLKRKLSKSLSEVYEEFKDSKKSKKDKKMFSSLEERLNKQDKLKKKNKNPNQMTENIKSRPKPSTSNSTDNLLSETEVKKIKSPIISRSKSEQAKSSISDEQLIKTDRVNQTQLTRNKKKKKLNKNQNETYEEPKKSKKNKQKIAKKKNKNPSSMAEDLKTSSLNLMNQLITDVKNRPKRIMKLSSSNPTDSSWIINNEVKKIKPSKTSVSKEEKIRIPQGLHPKDFKNLMLTDQKRVKRVDMKTLLNRKGAFL